MDENNALGILNRAIVVAQQQKSRSKSTQSNNSLAPFRTAKGATGARKGSSNAQKKRKKNRRVERAKQLIRDYGNGERPANREVLSRTLYLGEYRQLLQEIGDDSTLNNTFENELR